MKQTMETWKVYYRDYLIGETTAVSMDKAINNVRWNRFLSRGLWADWGDFDAIPKVNEPYKKEDKNSVSLRKATESAGKVKSPEESGEQVRWVQLSFL